MVEILTALEIYILCCGVLVFGLLAAFVIAVVCKWERLMSDLAIHREKVGQFFYKQPESDWGKFITGFEALLGAPTPDEDGLTSLLSTSFILTKASAVTSGVCLVTVDRGTI